MTAGVADDRYRLPTHRHKFDDDKVVPVELPITGEVVARLCPECHERVRPWYAPIMALEEIRPGEPQEYLAAWLDAEPAANRPRVRPTVSVGAGLTFVLSLLTVIAAFTGQYAAALMFGACVGSVVAVRVTDRSS